MDSLLGPWGPGIVGTQTFNRVEATGVTGLSQIGFRGLGTNSNSNSRNSNSNVIVMVMSIGFRSSGIRGLGFRA